MNAIVWSHYSELPIKNPSERIRRIVPLTFFSGAHLKGIVRAIETNEPPSKWLGIDGGGLRPLAQMISRAWAEWYMQRGVDFEKIREPIPLSMRARVMKRDGRVCRICGGAIADDEVVHLDHIKPVVLGGMTVDSNLRVTHERCNLAKGARYTP